MVRRCLTSKLGPAFWAVLAAQLAVPLIQLGSDRPARFGWQMFSGLGQHTSLDVVKADGEVEVLRANEVLVRWRPEIDVARLVPRHLCERYPDAVAVRRYPDGRAGAFHEVTCR